MIRSSGFSVWESRTKVLDTELIIKFCLPGVVQPNRGNKPSYSRDIDNFSSRPFHSFRQNENPNN